MKTIIQLAPQRQGLSDQAARELAAEVVLLYAREGCISRFSPEGAARDELIKEAKRVLGVHSRAAITTADMPLPTSYGAEIDELIADYGVIRRECTPWLIVGEAAKPPRVKLGYQFEPITMSATVPQKVPQTEWGTLTRRKFGGIMVAPSEISVDSLGLFGNALGVMSAKRFAWTEDSVGFLGDGTATYGGVTGICKRAATGGYSCTLGQGKTASADATAEDFRALRDLVNSKVRQTGAYFLANTWEDKLPTFNTVPNQMIFRYLADGSPILFGRPVVWTEVLQAYSNTPAPSANVAVYGDLSYFYRGHQGPPRVDTSTDVYFATDQVAVRFIEVFDLDCAATDAAAVLQTAAA